jgi:hypothetical protein
MGDLLSRGSLTTPLWLVAGAVFLFVFWIVVRLLGGGHSNRTWTIQVGSTSPAPVDLDQTNVSSTQLYGQPWDERKEQLLHNLDIVERGVGRFFVVLLSLLMAAATGVVVFIYLKLPDDGNRQSLLLYAGVAYLLGMVWMASQLFSVLRRISPPPDMLSRMRSRINVTFQSPVSSTHLVDNETLDRAERYINSGGSLEEACALIDPGYRSMNAGIQQTFRQAIQAALDQRKRQ